MLLGKNLHIASSYLIYLGCAFAFFTVPFGLNIGRNVFYLSSYIAFIMIVLNFRHYTKNKFNLFVSSCLLALGLAIILWVARYKQQDEYINIYRAYMGTARLQIAAAFIMLFALNEKIPTKKIAIFTGIFAGVIVNAFGLYQGLWLGITRISLNFDRATIVAYILTAISLVMMQSILMMRIRYRLVIYTISFAFTYSTLLLTGTRAAIIAYPIIIFLSIMATKNLINGNQKKLLLLALPLLIVISGLVFKKQIEMRINDFQNNIAMVDNTKVENSVYARVWMQIVGIRTGNTAPLGQSAEKRADEARTIISNEPRLYNAKRYLTVHLHNEVLETYSLRGIWGVLLLVATYASLLILSFRPKRNVMLLGVSLALILYGLSDVLFFSIECTAVFLISIIISILANRSQDEEHNQNV
ncbi:O-antigen ligase family protein [Erwinia sp. MYb535]|uniref:O-antigen ligase family protein n=2 Tax=unclassified Erwinia TaxID=2622719 RepID=UPI0030B2DEEC